jgi:hypothetical protein
VMNRIFNSTFRARRLGWPSVRLYRPPRKLAKDAEIATSM